MQYLRQKYRYIGNNKHCDWGDKKSNLLSISSGWGKVENNEHRKGVDILWNSLKATKEVWNSQLFKTGRWGVL